MKGLDIPIFFISFPDASLLLKTIGKNAAIKKSTVINLVEEDNLWIKVATGGFWIFLEVILLLSYAFDWIIGIRAIILHINKEGFKPTIAQTTIWINLAGTFIFAMFIFDAWNIRYISSSSYAGVMLTLYPPALLTSVFFLSFFFNEVLISKGFLKPQLSTLKFPFALVCMTCWGAYIADAVYFGSNRSNVNLIKTVTLMNVLFFSIAEIYFLTVGTLIVFKLKTFESPILKRIIPLIIVISFGIALFIVGAIIETSQAFSVYEPRRSLANFSLYFISSFFIFTPQFIFFREPKLTKSANSGSNKHTTPPTASKKMVQLN